MNRAEWMDHFDRAAELLPPCLKRLALALPETQKKRAEELRLRVARPLTVLTPEGELSVAPANREAIVDREDLEQMVSALTE